MYNEVTAQQIHRSDKVVQPNEGSILGQRRRQWPSIEPELALTLNTPRRYDGHRLDTWD